MTINTPRRHTGAIRLLKGVSPSSSESRYIRNQLQKLGWVIFCTHCDTNLDLLVEPLLESLGLIQLDGVRKELMRYDRDVELWVNLPHTDGTREARVPSLAAVRVLEPDDRGGGVTYLVPVHAIVKDMYDRNLLELLRFAETTEIPFRGRTKDNLVHNVLDQFEGHWRASVFRPAMDWLSLSTEPSLFLRTMELVAWIERLATESQFKVTLDLSAGQTLLFDNRRFVHWRSGISPGSPRCWERRFFGFRR